MHGVPGPHQQPFMAPPPSGPPAPPPPGRPAPTARHGLLAVAAVVYVLVFAVAAALVAVSVSGDDPKATFHPPDRSAEHLMSAAVDLLGAPGARYRGRFVDGDDRRVDVDASVTNEGSTIATLTTRGEKVTLALAGDRAFLRASEEFWRDHRAPRDSVAQYGKRWVKVPPDFFGIDIGGFLSPGALARALGEQAEQGRARPGDTSTIGGVEVRALHTPEMTVYVTTAEPRRIVRIAARPDAGVQPTPSSHHTSRWTGDRAPIVPVWAPAITDYQVDLSKLTDAEVTDLYRRLEDKIRELSTSIDSQVRFALNGAITLSPCNTGGCRANVTISNTVDSRSPYLKAKKRVHATITIRMTLDGRPVANCKKTKTMRPNGSASVSCFAAYYIPPSRNPRTHVVRAVASAVARAMVTADIKKLVEDLAREQKRNRPAPTPAPTKDRRPPPVPDAPTPAPSQSDDDECDVDPFLDPQGENYVRSKHFDGGGGHVPGKSTWDDDVDLYELAEDAADFPVTQQPHDRRCARIGDAGRPIGTDTRGRVTSRYKVVHLTNGRVWNMYPI